MKVGKEKRVYLITEYMNYIDVHISKIKNSECLGILEDTQEMLRHSTENQLLQSGHKYVQKGLVALRLSEIEVYSIIIKELNMLMRELLKKKLKDLKTTETHRIFTDILEFGLFELQN